MQKPAAALTRRMSVASCPIDQAGDGANAEKNEQAGEVHMDSPVVEKSIENDEPGYWQLPSAR
jgi:hypothetical protein